MSSKATSGVTIIAAESADRIAPLMVGYLEEMAQFTEIPTDKSGAPHYPYLPHYWQAPDRFPFLLRHQGEDCGFALVRTVIDPEDGTTYQAMAEFYIAPGFRRSGLGQEAAEAVMKKFKGSWEVSVLKANLPAQPFWQQVLEGLCPDLKRLVTESGYSYRLVVKDGS